MIARITGTILESNPLLVVIDCNGLGYEVNVPITTSEKIAGIGTQCALFTHSVYREDTATLYGFATREDRDFFRLLVEKVSGIGPKIGISILSRMPVSLLRSAIANSDIALLTKCPGIGKKTAERVVIELKDKVGLISGAETDSSNGVITSNTSTTDDHFQDTVASLITLGYKLAEADKLARKASQQLPADASVEERLKKALS
jgi:holliday junction DNA helicase RuvA